MFGMDNALVVVQQSAETVGYQSKNCPYAYGICMDAAVYYYRRYFLSRLWVPDNAFAGAAGNGYYSQLFCTARRTENENSMLAAFNSCCGLLAP
jgi:hypothetical protein